MAKYKYINLLILYIFSSLLQSTLLVKNLELIDIKKDFKKLIFIMSTCSISFGTNIRF